MRTAAPPPLASLLDEALGRARSALLDQRCPAGHWRGHLSSSALSTATAAFALALHDRASRSDAHATLVQAGLDHLARSQNPDGGWGDTDRSLSNISTSVLCWSALAGSEARHPEALRGARAYLARCAGSLEPTAIAAAVVRRYGKDRTFSVPILTMAALAGRIPWRLVPQLPFELAALPHRFYAAVRLPVVSYALPALIAIGQARHHHRPTWNPLARLARLATRSRTQRILRDIQPAGGGFLEATPLTSFVLMSLLSAPSTPRGDEVVRDAVAFLERSARPDGSWPIDTDLATWLTTLSVNALRADPAFALPEDEAATIRAWLLAQQYQVEHPYTHAAPGGWAWTDLPGGVPDADDTPGALLALHRLGPDAPGVREAAARGVAWLLDLQNRDGGIPTFCRGWTGLPFDRSGADLTAHALLAWRAWSPHLPEALRARVADASARARDYLARAQRPDGSWVPLWFGNQHAPDDENPTYGTARVLMAVEDHARAARGLAWLCRAQNPDGGWGGAPGIASSVEETSLAIVALASRAADADDVVDDARQRLARAVAWLADRVLAGNLEPSPIGFYFARLWYHERLYPLVFATHALSAARTALR